MQAGHQENQHLAVKSNMRISIHLLLLLCFSLCMHAAHATQWVTLKKSSQSTLMIDKQSITEQPPYTKAWVKVDYLRLQKNTESVDRLYNNARALWYFDCNARKASTIQVFQYEDQELVYSAGIDAKQADFVEPLPESEVEIAQQYICQQQASEKRRAEKKAEQQTPAKTADAKADAGKPDQKNQAKPTENGAEAKPKTDEKAADKTAAKGDTTGKEAAAKATAAEADAKKKADAEKAKVSDPKDKATKDKDAKVQDSKGNAAEKDTDKNKDKDKDKDKDKKDNGKEKDAKDQPAEKNNKDQKSEKKEDKKWSYGGDSGPEKWGSINEAFRTCSTGKQQSPIVIDNTISAALKPLKRLHKFPLTAISHEPHQLTMDAGAGNMMVLDQKPYQLKTISIHVPAEHQLKQKQYAAEMQMLHEDKSGHYVVIAVLFEEGQANPMLDKLLTSLPKEGELHKPLSMRMTPADWMPTKPAYYRYSGSLTTPPCSEGVQWVVMKEALKISKPQIEALQAALGGPNHRPLQEGQGRMILE